VVLPGWKLRRGVLLLLVLAGGGVGAVIGALVCWTQRCRFEFNWTGVNCIKPNRVTVHH